MLEFTIAIGGKRCKEINILGGSSTGPLGVGSRTTLHTDDMVMIRLTDAQALTWAEDIIQQVRSSINLEEAAKELGIDLPEQR